MSLDIINGDSLEILKNYENTFDLIFADPPYFLSNNTYRWKGFEVDTNKGEWDKSKNIDEIDMFNLEWLELSQKALNKDGSILVSGTHHNIFSVGVSLQKLGYKILNVITWKKLNPPPNFCCRYLTHSTEQIIWAKKNEKSKHYFNYDLMRKLNNNKQMLDVWEFTAPAKWEKENGKHTTQKPLNLLIRLLLMASSENHLICDPFCGSGTTGVACKILNRSFVGIEKEKEYFELSKKRINQELKVNIYERCQDLKIIEELKSGGDW